MSASPSRSTRSRTIAVMLAVLFLGGCGNGGGDTLVARGRQVYLAQCIQCHNANPAIPGPVGPAVKGAARELLDAKVVRGEYPPGYRPQRPTKVMPPQPTLAPDISALAAYLK
jgi:mono/diheme cytochrome c family protein